eukprot:GEMP01081964.1.p1 GENE.GEMP01081964.1~~GEMP01081964.1.p1  ORF type:complete len:226 (+),score=39.63 GEMP01081964.1:133-810(+)
MVSDDDREAGEVAEPQDAGHPTTVRSSASTPKISITPDKQENREATPKATAPTAPDKKEKRETTSTRRTSTAPLNVLTLLSKESAIQLVDPKNLNAGCLHDIYQERYDDFPDLQTLEVGYIDQHGELVREILLLEKGASFTVQEPRMCVSVHAVRRMHSVISVLARKIDNMRSVVTSCRDSWTKEVTHLRHLLSLRRSEMKAHAMLWEPEKVPLCASVKNTHGHS